MAVRLWGSAKQTGIAKGISIIARVIDLRTVIVLAICANLAGLAQGSAADTTCTLARSIFESKGLLSSADLLQTPTSDGGGLCLTSGCCGPAARAKLAVIAKSQLENTVRNDLNKLSNVLASRANRFDDFFKSLLVQSKHEFHEMFQRTYGMIYERHSWVFMDLFQQLERYYSKGDVDLAQVMDKFFVVLYQKMFTVLNQQYTFDENYLQCVSDHMREIQPFDDVPHKLSIQLRRAFVATRTFQKALHGGAEVAKSMGEMEMTPECVQASAAVKWCGACSGVKASSCSRRCLNVAKACLAAHADLAPVWDSFVDAIDKVADRLLGPFNIAMVVEPIDIKISEAIMNFQEHHQEISQKIFTGCGKPVLGGAPAVPPPVSGGSSNFGQGVKRDKRSYDNDFEIDESYESIMKNHPLFLNKNDFVFASDEEFSESDKRFKRDAAPEPKKNSKEMVDYDSYEYDTKSRNNNKKKGKKGQARKIVSEDNDHDGTNTNNNNAGSGGGAALEGLVRDARARVRATRRYFTHLPYLLCDEPGDSCFNGTHMAGYTLPAAGEGTAALASNPELKGAATQPPKVPQTANGILKTLTNKLNSAYNGMPVLWSDYEETETAASSRDSLTSTSLFDGSGSGSGDMPDDIDDFDDDEDQPRNKFPPRIDDVNGSGDGSSPTTDDDFLSRTSNPTVIQDTTTNRGSSSETSRTPAAAAAPRQPLPQALITYLFPVVCAWLGGLVTDLV